MHPTNRNGQAELAIFATAARFMGIPFRELPIGIFVSREQDGSERDGMFLIHAFNSSRFFAFVERTFFHTPYYPGDIHVSIEPPVAIRLTANRRDVLQLEMRPDTAHALQTASHASSDIWEGPIFLPTDPTRKNAPRRLFYGRLQGTTRSHACSANDIVSIRPAAEAPVFAWLLESGFTGREWTIRENATHAKSKTVARNHLWAPVVS